jgi:antitoxin (DNA-binding transcriptional repressor) of toxin-antitoxin stability system
MEIIAVTELAANVLKVVELAQRGIVVSVVDNLGKVIARIVPGDVPMNASPDDAFARTQDELDRLIADIAPYLPGQVDAVQTIREIRE